MGEKYHKIKKYVISGKSIILILVIFVISFFCFCILSIPEIGESYISNVQVRQVVINSFLVIASITGTNLLTSLIIEKNSKNQEWRNIISQDVLSNHAFYDYMDSQTKDAISSAIKYSINEYNNTVLQNEIMQSIVKKLNFQRETYYFNKCDYSINCEVFSDCIKYDMKRVTEIYSYEDEYIIPKFRIAVVANSCDNTHDISHIEISLNGRQLTEDEYIIESGNPNEESDIERNEYNTIKSIYLKGPLTLYSEKNGKNNCTTIVYKQIAETTLDDVVNSYRASKPCKNFSVYFNLETKDKYKLVSNAFGFIDTPNGEKDMDVDYISRVEFNDWVFEDDGVVITVVPR